jgi:hypothetical protein
MSEVRSPREEYAHYYRQPQSHVPHGRLYQSLDGTSPPVNLRRESSDIRLPWTVDARSASGCSLHFSVDE